MDPMELRLSELEIENTRLQLLVVELLIQNQQLRESGDSRHNGDEWEHERARGSRLERPSSTPPILLDSICTHPTRDSNRLRSRTP